MKIAVLGGSGFIGTEVVKLLSKLNHDIIIGDIVPPEDAHKVYYQNCDITKPDNLAQTCRHCDVIINLAAVHRDDVRPLSRYDEVNVQGSQNITECANNLDIKHIIFTSSVAVYGFPQGEPDEDTPHAPFNDYGRTKSEAEDVYLAWATADKTTTIIRPTVVFGPGNRGNVYNLLRQLASGAFVMIGAGKNKKSMAYVENVAAFIVHALNFQKGTHIYNYVDKPDFDMNTLVSKVRVSLGKKEGVGLRLPYWFGYSAAAFFDIIAYLTKKTFPISRIRIQKFCSDTVFSAKAAHTQCGFKAPHDLETALSRTIEHEFASKN